MKTTLLILAISISAVACREEFHQLTPPADSPVLIETKPTCQAPSIEENIVGTWHFESSRTSDQFIRTGSVTFTAQNHIIDPDSLFENSMDLGIFVDKVYDTDGTYPSKFEGYNGKIFRVDLLLKDNRKGTIWPFYVASNECNKIVIYELGTYQNPVARKSGFTLIR
ncbi:hypothetical protein GCM10028818_59460 [Spirosoma horti]